MDSVRQRENKEDREVGRQIEQGGRGETGAEETNYERFQKAGMDSLGKDEEEVKESRSAKGEGRQRELVEE